MKKEKLREFEEMILLSVISLSEGAYGVEIKRELESKLDNQFSVGSIQSTLKRMEAKGLLTSRYGEATERRGGKRKRIYSGTPYASRTLEQIKDLHSQHQNSESHKINKFQIV